MKRKTVFWGMLAMLLVAVAWLRATDALAQTGGPYDLSWSSVDGGAQASAGGSYWIGGTAGQPDAGDVLTGGDFDLTGGFWSFQEGNPTAVTLRALGVERVSGDVLLAFGVVACLGGAALWRWMRRR
jgi:hypothetical protein